MMMRKSGFPSCFATSDLKYVSSLSSLSSLEKDINEASLALDYFLDNRISECMELLLAKSDYSLYHSLGLSAAKFMYSVLTFERVRY